jgi:hypothetical protein
MAALVAVIHVSLARTNLTVIPGTREDDVSLEAERLAVQVRREMVGRFG